MRDAEKEMYERRMAHDPKREGLREILFLILVIVMMVGCFWISYVGLWALLGGI